MDWAEILGRKFLYLHYADKISNHFVQKRQYRLEYRASIYHIPKICLINAYNPVLSWQFCTALSNHMLFQAILCYPEQSCAILNNPPLSWGILLFPKQSCAITSNPMLSWEILSYPEQSSVLSQAILSYPRLYTNTSTTYIYIGVTMCWLYKCDWCNRPTGIVTTREALASKKLMACSISL